jgi:class 3 adenylate cyclase/predicted ATPase
MAAPQAKFCGQCATPLTAENQSPTVAIQSSAPNQDVAERRQLTVMFCDLVGSTELSARLDPEELREVVRAYQHTSAAVINRYEGCIAQYLGDGLLVYFGYPTAHEDDAQRAVRAGVEIIEALQKQVPSPLMGEDLSRARQQAANSEGLHVRIGIHTGLVVVGEMGGGNKRELLAMGETPNIAARLQGFAEPDTVVMSAATHHLVHGFFACQDLGPHTLKGITTPVPVYRVLNESEAQSRFEVTIRTGLTPLVGRDEELGLLQERWEQAKAGKGQIILVSGEPGIGKSRLVQELKDQVMREGCTRIEFRCSPYYQNTAFYPVIDHLQRLLHFKREDVPQEKLAKLERMLKGYSFPLQEVVPLFATLLSLPHPEGYPSINLTPQRQRQKTQEALGKWLLAEAERKMVLAVWEDLQWADPSTIELHGVFMERTATAPLLTVLTFRPEFTPPWGSRPHVTALTLSRLERGQIETMVKRIAKGASLPVEVLHQVVDKTDGVPLFVEELTKNVLETVGAHGRAPLQSLDIPATLHDALMARLDRLSTAKEIAQLGATLGREFPYELLQAVALWNVPTLQQALARLIEAEILHQRGDLSQTRYFFKHALIQDAAYQSLLKSKRQQYHQQIVQVLEGQFAEVKETQPELLAHHYTEAGLGVQAIPYWQQAGQRAVQRSAHREAINHFTKGLELLKLLPDTIERIQQELRLQITLGPSLIATKGYADPAVGGTFTRASELCRQIGEIPQLFPVLMGLRSFYTVRGELRTARKLGEQLLQLAESVQDLDLLLEAHYTLGVPLYLMGEFALARSHVEQGIALYDPQKHRSHAFLYGQDPGVGCRSVDATTLWCLGYPDQALQKNYESISLARELSHPHSLAFALIYSSVHLLRREARMVQVQAEVGIALAHEQGFPIWSTAGTIWRGWALAEQDQGEEGVAQIRQGLAAWRATGAEGYRVYYLALLAEACGKVGQTEEGLNALAEALTLVGKTGERIWETELYRLKGKLTLQKGARDWRLGTSSSSSQTPSPKPPVSRAVEDEAEGYFLKAIEIARQQQAKSWELRATTPLARLWQSQGKQHAARSTLSEIYDWFTEGFDTKDLQEAKALLEELRD